MILSKKMPLPTTVVNAVIRSSAKSQECKDLFHVRCKSGICICICHDRKAKVLKGQI